MHPVPKLVLLLALIVANLALDLCIGLLPKVMHVFITFVLGVHLFEPVNQLVDEWPSRDGR